VDALVGTAEIVYPSAVENIGAFVETYASTKLDRRPAFANGAVEAVDALDAEAKLTFDESYLELDDVERETVIRSMGADTADPNPDGTGAQRVRYYLVNEVLYALFTSPTGGTLVGNDNPDGHPGGIESYRQGPTE